MSKHHHDGKQWREIMEQGRRKKAAGAPRAGGGGKPQGGTGAAGASTTRPDQPLRRPRPGKPPRSAPAARAHAPAVAGSDPAAAPAAPRKPQLDGLGLPYITLAQLLKKLSLVGSGGEAKATVRSGGIRVNGVDETRPGRKLHQGDKVTISGHDHHVSLSSG